LKDSVGALARDLPEGAGILLVDDGSSSGPDIHDADPRVHVLRHEKSQGPAAARNTGIRWCLERGTELLILLDSDCIPEPGFVATHVRLNEENPEAVCIGGAIRGVGKGVWARLDGICSWFTSMPGSSPRRAGKLYHIPTTNMSIKLKQLPENARFFDARLRTGEDVEFMNRLHASGAEIMFFPIPLVTHMDREDFKGFLAHQYRWGLHTYAVRLKGRKKTGSRLLLAAAFALLLPAYAFATSLINLVPWLRVSVAYVFYWPVLFLVYAYKGIGVLEGILKPERALYPS